MIAPVLRTIARSALDFFKPKTLIHRGVVLPAKRFRFGGVNFIDDETFLSSGEHEADRLIREFMLTNESRVLEIGCGPGRLPIGILSRIGNLARYEAVDVSKPAIRWCRKFIGRTHPSFKFTLLDLRNERYNPRGTLREMTLPFADASFDIIYLYSVFSHLLAKDVEEYMKEFARLLAPGGSIFCTAFIEENVPDVSENPIGYRDQWKGPLHCMRYDKVFFENLLRKHGLRIATFSYGTETDGQSGMRIRTAN